jgi:hypothetical protein
VIRFGCGLLVSARGGSACAGDAGGAGAVLCWAGAQTGKAKSAVAYAVPFLMLILLYGPIGRDWSMLLS